MENKKISEMRQSMTDAGFYTKEDIDEICRLEAEYIEECEQIALECEAEGYPAYGNNYDLRCENARKFYDEQLALIDAKYPELSE